MIQNPRKSVSTIEVRVIGRGIVESFIIEVSFTVGTSNSWCVDSSVTNHICKILQGFQKIEKLSNGEVTLHLRSEARVAAVSIGVVELVFSSNKILILNDYLFVPSYRRNSISISVLFKQGYSILFSENVYIKLNESFICSGKLVDGLYLINPMMYEIHDTELNKSQNLTLEKKASFNNPTYFWHLRLGHIKLKRIDRLVKEPKIM